MSPAAKKALIALLLVLLFHVWAFWKRSDLALDDACQPQGVAAQVREFYDARGFWRTQVRAIDSSLEVMRERSAGAFEAEALARQATVDTEAQLQALHKELEALDPSLAPTSNQKRAEELRRQADELEAAENARIVREFESKVVQWLSMCRETAVRRSSK